MVAWERVPPESLRGADLPDRPAPVALVRTGSGWILLGSAFDRATDTGVGVAWFGRSPD